MDCMALRLAGARHCDASAPGRTSWTPSELAPPRCPTEPSAPSFRGWQSSRLGRSSSRVSVAAQVLGGVVMAVVVWQEEVWRGVSDLKAYDATSVSRSRTTRWLYDCQSA